MSSTRTLVTLLRPWIRRFTIIISAWWLRTSSKFTWEEVKTSTGKLGKWSTPKRVRIRPKYSAPSLSRDRRIKMHQSINQSINHNVIIIACLISNVTLRHCNYGCIRTLSLRPHKRHEIIDSQFIYKMAGLLQIAGKKKQIPFDVKVKEF